MKNKRHEAIIKIIKENDISTQEGLQEMLKASGFDVTQATVSRDIKTLALAKTQNDNGKYCYSIRADNMQEKRKTKFQSVFLEAVISVDYAQNIVAVKCHVGMGNAACAALDLMNLGEVVGTLAGDDTIFVLLRDTESAATFAEKLYQLISND